MMGFKRVYLLGFMGCGKSTVGKSLAKEVQWDFIDLDDFIEKKSGMSIPDVFQTHGEDYFRQLESEAVAETTSMENVIIATGGGAPCFHKNMEAMNQAGLTIYLQLSAEGLRDRLKPAKTNRPLISNKSDDELLEFIKEKLAERESYYKLAKVTADATAVGPQTYINILKSYQSIK